MILFLRKLTAFLLFLILATAGLYFFSRLMVGRKENLVLNGNPTTLFMGHSRAECAFNDSVLKQSRNLGISAESYFYTYIKLKAILKSNDISTVFIEFSNRQVSAFMDSTITGDYYLSRSCKKYQSFMNATELKLVAARNPRKFITIQPVVMKQQLAVAFQPASSFYQEMNWGAYDGLPYNKVDSIIAARRNGAEVKMISRKKAVINLNYLDSILALCEAKHIRAVLMRTPTHPSSLDMVNEPEFREVLQSRYSKYEFHDYNNFPLQNDDYADLEHLNKKGSIRFSQFIQKEIDDRLLNNSQKLAGLTVTSKRP